MLLALIIFQKSFILCQNFFFFWTPSSIQRHQSSIFSLCVPSSNCNLLHLPYALSSVLSLSALILPCVRFFNQFQFFFCWLFWPGLQMKFPRRCLPHRVLNTLKPENQFVVVSGTHAHSCAQWPVCFVLWLWHSIMFQEYQFEFVVCCFLVLSSD